MRQELKKCLQESFEAPAPKNKQFFFRKIKSPKISYWDLVMAQARYIRKWVWVLSFALFAVAVIGSYILDRNVLWILSAMMPFLAVSAITENVRSQVYGMAELEKASRFSLRCVLLARMGILGIVHFMVLCLVVLIGYKQGENTIFQTGVYMFVPYLLTDAGGLWLFRKIRGNEAVYASMGLAVIISAVPIMKNTIARMLYDAKIFGWWIAALVIFGSITVLELKKKLEEKEVFTWNSL